MEKSYKLEAIPPRYLKYRSHYRIYLIFLVTVSVMVLSFWGFQLYQNNWQTVYSEYAHEFWISLGYFAVFGSFYFFWLKSRISRSVQVFEDHVRIHNNGKVSEVRFEDVESVGVVCWSIFYFKMNNGTKHYFSSSLERVDYIWEGFNQARPGVVGPEEFAAFRTRLVQYDHHQKRKEWFFRHKLVDVFNWIILPALFLGVTYFVQTRDVVINQQGMYFFRLTMYSILTLILTTFMFSIVLKKFIFDKRVKLQINSESPDKLRDLEFEGIVVHRSKIMQMLTATFLFALIVKSEMNLFSLTKVREDLTTFNLRTGKTLVVDNRYNCTKCKFPVRDGDIIVFGKGTVGQVMATEGDMVGLISQDNTGRTIASENVHEVPQGHIAVKLSTRREILMVQTRELIGKIKK